MDTPLPAPTLDSQILVTGISDARLARLIESVEFGEADFARLGQIQDLLDQAGDAIWAPLQQMIAAALKSITTSPQHHAGLMRSLQEQFRDLLKSPLQLEAVCDRMQLWLDSRYLGMAPEWPSVVHDNYLDTVAAQLAIHSRADSTNLDADRRTLQKYVFLNLGLINVALLEAEKQVDQQQIFYDATTKLPGHEAFLCNLDTYLRAASREEQPLCAILRLDVTPSHRLLGYPGYPTLDQFMLEVSIRLKSILRPDDLLARFGRNEFALLLPGIRSSGQVMLAAHKLLTVLEPSLLLDPIEINALPTLGISLYPEHGNDSPTLVRLAETACIAARSSPDPYVIYQPSLDQNERLQRSLETDLRSALRENEFLLYFQPQLTLESGAISGAEALLRWRNPRGEFVPPHVIVKVAEQCGLMNELTRWIVNCALRHSADMRKVGVDIAVSVNLSAQDLVSSEFVEIIDQTLRTWNVPAARLVLEITEGSMIEDIDKVMTVLQRLKYVGVEISIDDFGTGYSSLAYLKRLPLDELKIDQVFIKQMLKQSQDERIVRTIIDLAHTLQLRVVAEGVEDEATKEALKLLDCDVIQGYTLSRPLPVADFVQWCQSRQSTS